MSKMVERDAEQRVMVQGMAVTPDPTGFYKGISPSALLASLGLIPYFIAELAMTADVMGVEDAVSILEEAYGFPVHYDFLARDGSTIMPDGSYVSEGDRTLFPRVKFELSNGFVIYCYDYGMLGLTLGDREEDPENYDEWMGRFD